MGCRACTMPRPRELIGRLHLQGVSRLWREADAERRALLAEVSLVDLGTRRAIRPGPTGWRHS